MAAGAQDETIGRPRRRRLGPWPWALAVAAFVGAVVLVGVLPRLRARVTVDRDTRSLAVPVVSVVRPRRAPAVTDLVLPGSVQGFRETPIFARTSGYLRRWYADIGTRVKK